MMRELSSNSNLRSRLHSLTW